MFFSENLQTIPISMNTDIPSKEIFPRIKVNYDHEIYAGDQGRHIQEGQFEKIAERLLKRVHVHMMEDLGLNFAVSEASRFRLILEKDRLGLVEWTDMQFIQHAFSNLLRQYGEQVEVLGQPETAMRIKVGNELEASFLLLGNLWQKLAAEYGENLYAAIPRQDLLLIAAANNRKGILQLQTAVKAVFLSPDSGPLLSKAIYQRWDGEWKIVAAAF